MVPSKCPYCGKEMDDGMLHGTSFLFWGRKKRNWGLRRKEGDFYLDRKIIDHITVEGYFCPACNVIILDALNRKRPLFRRRDP